MFKWTCLAVATVALIVFGWMLNDMRVEVKRVAAQADAHLPRILSETERVAGQLDTHLPRLLSQTETAADNINRHLPPLLKNSEQAAATLNDQLPRLLTSSEAAADGIAQLADDFGDYKAMMSVVHAAKQEKSLFSYGSSILSFIEGQPATIGRKKAGMLSRGGGRAREALGRPGQERRAGAEQYQRLEVGPSQFPHAAPTRRLRGTFSSARNAPAAVGLAPGEASREQGVTRRLPSIDRLVGRILNRPGSIKRAGHASGFQERTRWSVLPA